MLLRQKWRRWHARQLAYLLSHDLLQQQMLLLHALLLVCRLCKLMLLQQLRRLQDGARLDWALLRLPIKLHRRNLRLDV